MRYDTNHCFRFNYAWDPMSADELHEITEALKNKAEAYRKIELREKEIAGIRDCKIAAKRKLRRSNRRIEARAFKGYMDLFYRPQKKIQVVI